jgi:hypothetical protein
MACKKLRTIRNRAVRELDRELSESALKEYQTEFVKYKKVLSQERNSKTKPLWTESP